MFHGDTEYWSVVSWRQGSSTQDFVPGDIPAALSELLSLGKVSYYTKGFSWV